MCLQNFIACLHDMHIMIHKICQYINLYTMNEHECIFVAHVLIHQFNLTQKFI